MAAVRARRLGGAVDLAVVAALIGVANLGFGPTFGGGSYLVAAGSGTLLGLGLAWVGALRRLSTVSLAGATVLAYFAFGGVVVLPQTTIAGVLPTLATVRGLGLGAVTSWKGLLTIVPPVEAFPEVGIVPYLSCLVVAVLAGSLALRARRVGWALLPVAGLTVGVILMGTAQVAWPLAQGIAFGILGLGWSAWRRASARSEALRAARAGIAAGDGAKASRALRTRRIRNAAVMLAIAGTLTAVAAPLLQPVGQRQVLRDQIVPPLDLREYPSPLVGFRKYVKDLDKQVLFTVSGLPRGARIRLATMDAYTGTVFDVAGGTPGSPTGSGSFNRMAPGTGSGAALPAGARTDEVSIKIAAYRGVWLPEVGRSLAITFSGGRADALAQGLYGNSETGTVLSTAGLRSGDRFTVRSLVAAAPAVTGVGSGGFADLQLPAPARVPQSVTSVANTFVGDASTAADKVGRLREALSSGGVFSDGLDGQLNSRAGHGSDRIDTLLSGAQMVGDDEQFAVAMALMARQLGIPARVVMGFYPKANSSTRGGVYAVTGGDVHAWVEVAFAGAGWVTFDPTPRADQPPKAQDPRSKSRPQPQVLQAPPPPDEPAEAPLQPIAAAADADKKLSAGTRWLGYLARAAEVALPIVVLASPFVLILVAKSRRRRRRLGAQAAEERLSGGWREVTDAAMDLGTPVLASDTRRESAGSLQVLYPRVRALALAERADAAVFGAYEPTDADVSLFWADVEQIVADMSLSAGRWGRLRGRFSVRSLIAVRSLKGLLVPGFLGRAQGLVGLLSGAIGHVPAVLGRVRARPFRGGRR
ncbi:MAG: transglutaminaseTgpA domain-containing protein [Actinomycetota bacterium]